MYKLSRTVGNVVYVSTVDARSLSQMSTVAQKAEEMPGRATPTSKVFSAVICRIFVVSNLAHRVMAM